ncbi:Transposase, Ptta/En/Spm, plant [Corchorus olitorius]|uniref:Transposase, Ptta/En/Spm, plant n=1 Tax=Corchorus olitorius TaxID=93759 RepID=A0A1R3KPL4_9ROSI|nr:Transposase, Ptta/En/Spm, plant [Corchorus olitorius]
MNICMEMKYWKLVLKGRRPTASGGNPSESKGRATPNSRLRLNEIDTVALLPAHVPPPAHDVTLVHEEDVNNGEGENSSMNDNEGVQVEEVVEQRQQSQQIQQISRPDSEDPYQTHCYPAIFTWEREDEAEVRKKFNSRAAKWLKDALEKARKKKKQAGWIIDDIWHRLWQMWNIEEYQKLCKKNQQNRKSDNHGSMTTYHGGSASFEDHKKKMEIEAGGPVLVVDVFKKIFRREDKTWKEIRARIAYEKFKKAEEEQLVNAVEGEEINYDLLWWEICEHKGGSCFGFGNLVEDFQSSMHNLASSSVSEVFDPKIHKAVGGTLPSLPVELARTMESGSHVPRASEDVDQPTANGLPAKQQ